jgi:CelD/BcsL family acetyltransferase involved in cellulose biosynthesis
MNVVQIDPFADARWLAFLEGTQGASIFHHPAWLKVLRETYDYSPICLAATEADSLVGLLPLMEVRSWLTGNRAVCLPFSDACGAVVRNEPALHSLLQYCEELRNARGWKYVEIRDSVVSNGFRTAAHYKLHRTSLDADSNALFRTLKKTQIQQPTAKARKLGVIVERRTDPQAIRALICLNALTRRKHGVPPQPDSLFLNIGQRMLDAGLGFVSTATLDGQIVATALFLHWKNTIVYKYSASHDRARSVGATHALIWDAMQWGCKHGFAFFDLGRSDLNNEGLLQFKSGWGSQESDLIYVRHGVSGRDHASDSPGMLERLRPVMSRVPLPILKLVGRKVYAHIG